MSTYRAQVVFPYFSLLPEDVITNTFHFTSVGSEPVEDCSAVITPLLADFYEACFPVGRQMANHVVPSQATVRWYNLADAPPRAPLVVPLGATMVTVASSVPTEVACVLSFQAPRLSGAPQSRRRGRIYLGGLTSGWISSGSASTYPIIATAAVTGVATAADALYTAANSGTFKWSVWSPTDGTFSLVTNGWVDNSPDTQRRRGVFSSLRTLWS